MHLRLHPLIHEGIYFLANCHMTCAFRHANGGSCSTANRALGRLTLAHGAYNRPKCLQVAGSVTLFLFHPATPYFVGAPDKRRLPSRRQARPAEVCHLKGLTWNSLDS